MLSAVYRRDSNYRNFLQRLSKCSSNGPGLCGSLLLGLGQDQQQHPAVHTGGIGRGRVRGCECWFLFCFYYLSLYISICAAVNGDYPVLLSLRSNNKIVQTTSSLLLLWILHYLYWLEQFAISVFYTILSILQCWILRIASLDNINKQNKNCSYLEKKL